MFNRTNPKFSLKAAAVGRIAAVGDYGDRGGVDEVSGRWLGSQVAFLAGLERGCVEDQPQHARNALRLTLRAQPRSDRMVASRLSGEKC